MSSETIGLANYGGWEHGVISLSHMAMVAAKESAYADSRFIWTLAYEYGLGAEIHVGGKLRTLNVNVEELLRTHGDVVAGRAIIARILAASNVVMTATRMGPGDVVFVTPATLELMIRAAADGVVGGDEGSRGLRFAGMLVWAGLDPTIIGKKYAWTVARLNVDDFKKDERGVYSFAIPRLALDTTTLSFFASGHDDPELPVSDKTEEAANTEAE